MELRQLRYFVTLAEEVRFGRAADREHVVQSALSQRPRRLGRPKFPQVIYWNEVDKGGHFAAWEQPVPFTAKVRAASRSLRELDGEGGGHNVRRPSPGSASLP